MGTGSANYRIRAFARWIAVGKHALQVLEVVLYLAFIADCFILIAGMGSSQSYYPPGGVGLIVLLLAISVVHRIRCGPD